MQHRRVTSNSRLLAIAFVLVQVALLAACNFHRTTTATPPGFRVALLTPGSVSDAGWNAAAFNGLQLIKSKLGAETALVQTKSPADFEDAFRDFASRGCDLTFSHASDNPDPALQL